MTDWKYHYNIKQFLNEDQSDAGAQKAGKAISDYLEGKTGFERGDAKIAIKLIKNAQNCGEINRALDLLYDYADENEIWLGI